MDAFSTIVRFFQEGGVFMYFILLLFAVGLAIAIERFIYLQSAKSKSRKMWNNVVPLIQAGNFDQASELAAKSKATISHMLAYGLARIKERTQHRDEIETAMEEGLMEVIPRLEKRTHYLATLANIATLMGLLGTIIGLIQAFTAVASADPSQKADLLSSSISVAMNTTAFGLMAAIPLLLMHAFLSTKTTELVDSFEMAAVKFLNIITKDSSAG
ncbi:flagellar motor protein MotA [Candidatus Tenderia electrophaga]|jgi:biopolymer transport protein ExbB/TolQ|uniref:Flagellar motor protein MotA n=1 Tax=Candidatus Tenderia electrophaga TaxID=1748243 RepID=A0A0S2TG67_9GAMM|nr:flagellar motor protein MotA [Candidatus Tenderia electrophaga]